MTPNTNYIAITARLYLAISTGEYVAAMWSRNFTCKTSTEIRITSIPFFNFMRYNWLFIVGRHTAKMGSNKSCCCRVSL